MLSYLIPTCQVSDDRMKNLKAIKMSCRNFDLFLKALTHITAFLLMIASVGGELSESEAFFNFIRSVDPDNFLQISLNGTMPDPCSLNWKGVKCGFQATGITEIRLENLNLSGVIGADSLCKIQNIQVLSLSNNLISGNIPDSISDCRKLVYLDLSSNRLSGRVTPAITKLKNLRTLDISNNQISGSIPLSELEYLHPVNYSLKQTATRMYNLRKLSSLLSSEAMDDSNKNTSTGSSQPPASSGPDSGKKVKNSLALITGIALIILFVLVVYFVIAKVTKAATEKEIVKSLTHSPQNNPSPVLKEAIEPDDGRTELVFFVKEQETFKLDDLFEATADLQGHTLYTSLYKVILKNNAAYAVKRLKKLQVSFEEFGKTMRQIGNMKHPNILPLVGFNSTSEEKLLIYKYQINGNLLNLIEGHTEGKIVFPWRRRLLMGTGIASGLNFIYQNSDKHEIIPHGNLKSSNILLDENDEPLISDYGLTRILDSKKHSVYVSNGYTAPERTLSEQGDVFSFGIILLELLTGKTIEKSGIDLPKWVKSMVREEWTGEVFDKEVSNGAREYAFPLLNIALKCVSSSPEDRPTMAEIMEKIEEIANVHDDVSVSSMASMDSSPRECCLLHTVIPETWDTPGSNY